MQVYFLNDIRAKQNKPLLNFAKFMLASLCFIWSIGSHSADLSKSTFNTLQTAVTGNSALPADQAFSLSAMIETPNTVVLMWEIEDGYYLYRKSLAFLETNSEITQPALVPEGLTISDEFFGETDVFYNKLLVKIPFTVNPSSSTAEKPSEIHLQLSYQGCAEIGYCYPMQQKLVILDISP